MSYELCHHSKRELSPGRFWPLGATVVPGGVNFALYSRDAVEVYLLLFAAPDADHPTDIIQVEGRDKFVWHVEVKGLRPGQLYGYKVVGPFEPALGLRFNPAKLLVDPYAKAVSHKAHNHDNLLLAYDPLDAGRDLTLDLRPSDAAAPKSVVVDDAFDWQGDVPPGNRLESLVIYEVHVKGFTAHRSSLVAAPGTYLGFFEKIPYLRKLGVNAVELLPIHERGPEDFKRGLTNYWGYNTLSYFAPESSYRAGQHPGCEVEEFKTLVRELHKGGIEVILDVVYNHTCEGSELGPTLSLRGVDNRSYYLLCGGEDAPGRFYQNPSGCGNALDLSSPPAIRLVMDSLRYWVEQMHVDGFRFDLASVLGREEGEFKGGSSFFDAISQDPLLQRVKLVAEPWDLGSYQVGNFPIDWSEWNGKFRDTARSFGKGDGGVLREMGLRIAGSPDLYKDDGRQAANSVNFVTCHDGFTLNDLVSYSGKHNAANLEDNRDGADDNHSWNCGVEGPTEDLDVLRLRRQMARNHLLLLLFSSGTPMLCGGDEMLRTQGGNNNAYCQDNDISWFDWGLEERSADMVAFVRKAIALTRRCTILQRRRFLLGADLDHDMLPDISWFGLDGEGPDWDDPQGRTLCFQLDGGEAPSDLGKYRLYVIINMDWRLHGAALPRLPEGCGWSRIVDTSLCAGDEIVDLEAAVPLRPDDEYLANPRSTVVLIGR
jgi:isoamylase